jgi:Uma2 family endonuclease
MLLIPERANRVVLNNISWQQFENLLIDLGEHRAARVAYDQGQLEIMTPLPEHEFFKETLSIAVQDIAELIDLNYESYSSTTWKRELQQAGLEPDNCFYFQNEAAIRGRFNIDLNQGDPPPDLALEINLTHKSLNRLPIYARLGVPELWCYDNGNLTIYQLQDREYLEAIQSRIFPNLAIPELPQIIESYRQEGRLALRRAIRAWARAQIT